MTNHPTESAPEPLAQMLKCPSGINGLDEITNGGLPRGRPTLVCGSSGTGKTLLAMEFLVRGIQQHNEPGVFICFEERAADLAANVASLGFDLAALIDDKKLFIDHIAIDRSEMTETGEYNLDGLFMRLDAAIDEVGAKRIVLDTIEILFASLTNQSILRSELRRLFAWIKEKGVTAIVTGERGDGVLTRNGLEEYVSDCVILLDNRLIDQVATRRLRIMKYRGSAHGSNEYPFLIDEHGFSVLPITTIGLHYTALRDIISTGIPKLDAMFGGNGYFRGGTLLVSGGAGTGKSSIAAHFVDAACQRGERCIYFAFEESPDQIVRNMRSIGIDLDPWRKAGALRFAAARPASLGLEVHLSSMLKLVDDLKPQVVVLDPVSSFAQAGGATDALAMLMRLVDLMKIRGITALFTSLTSTEQAAEQSEIGISSLIDTWLIVRNLEQAGERTRTLSVIKSRGMKHSNQARELILTDNRIDLADVFIGPDGKVLTGSARDAQEMVDRTATMTLQQIIAGKRAALARKQSVMDRRIAEMQAELAAETAELSVTVGQQEAAASSLIGGRALLGREREQSNGSRLPHNNGVRG
jgi:circadian clock protein KaiC